MDLDGQDRDERAHILLDDSEARPSGFRRVWKRLRSSLAPRRAKKAIKRSSTQVAGQVEGSRDIQTPSPSSRPPRITCGPRNLSQSQDTATKPQEYVEEKQGVEGPPSQQSLPVANLPDRPRLHQTAASEGNLITCPTKHILPERSRPNSEASDITYNSRPRPRTSPAFDNTQQVVLPSRRDRAASLFGKYGLAIDPEGHFSEDVAPEEVQAVQRVNKATKVRVHYHCHKCSMAIGSNGICIQCGHKRCRDCKRWPPRESYSGSCSSKDNRRSIPSLPPPSRRSETLDVWLSSPRPSTQGTNRTFSSLFSHNDTFLTRNIHRLCHRCHSPFIWTETRCQDCNHTICYACPRVSPQIQSEPTALGPSGPIPMATRIRERVFKKPRIRVRYNCDQCLSVFKEGSRKCPKCGHLRCESCVRWPPRSEPSREPNAAAIEAFRRRMETMP